MPVKLGTSCKYGAKNQTIKLAYAHTVKPAYNDTTRDRHFSFAGGFRLTQVLQVWIVGTTDLRRL